MVEQVSQWKTDHGRVFSSKEEAIKNESFRYGVEWGVDFVIQTYHSLADEACGGQGNEGMHKEAGMLLTAVRARLDAKINKGTL